MPLYDIQCDKCNTVQEVLVTDYCDKYVTDCKVCKRETLHTTLVPLATMRPDIHWSGTEVDNRVVYSEKEYKELMGNVEPATRANREWVEKRKQDALIDLEKKKEQRRDKFFSSIAHSIDLPA